MFPAGIPVDMPRSPLVSTGLLILSGLVIIVGNHRALARKINFADDSRSCLSISIAANHKVQNSTACIAHISCTRAIFATFDAYPVRPPRADAPIRAKVSHWVRPGDNVVFG
jgi:hypothetical protein